MTYVPKRNPTPIPSPSPDPHDLAGDYFCHDCGNYIWAITAANRCHHCGSDRVDWYAADDEDAP